MGIGGRHLEPVRIDCPPTCAHYFVDGSRVTLTATLAANAIFVGWSFVDCTGTGTCTLTPDATHHSAVANFARVQRTLTVSSAGSGVGTGTNTTCTLTMDADEAATANFARQMKPVYVGATGAS